MFRWCLQKPPEGLPATRVGDRFHATLRLQSAPGVAHRAHVGINPSVGLLPGGRERIEGAHQEDRQHANAPWLLPSWLRSNHVDRRRGAVFRQSVACRKCRTREVGGRLVQTSPATRRLAGCADLRLNSGAFVPNAFEQTGTHWHGVQAAVDNSTRHHRHQPVMESRRSRRCPLAR